MDYLQWLVILVFGLLVLGAFIGYVFYKRSQNEKFMKNRIIAEFWKEKGGRIRIPLPIEPNGIEVKCPQELHPDICPRYIFDHNDIDPCKYPENAAIGFTRCDARIVSWFENNPEPINRKREKPLVTSALIDSLRDNDFLAFATAASKEIEILQKQLQSALQKGIDKTTTLILLIIGIIASGAAAGLAYMAWQAVIYLQKAWGIS
jgi:hypothetical protein